MSLFVITSRITLGPIAFGADGDVVEVNLEHDYNKLADTCTIELAEGQTFRAFEGLDITKVILRGDPVKVELGYDGDLRTEFEGYVTRIKPGDFRITIECEDLAHLLKKHKVEAKEFTEATLPQVVEHLVPPGMKWEAIPMEVGSWVIGSMSAAQALEALAEIYKLVTFFRGTTLVVGWAHELTPQEQVFNYIFGYNHIDAKLDYRTADDYTLVMRGISNHRDGKTKIEYDYPEGLTDYGELRTHNVGEMSLDELKKTTVAAYEQINRDGYVGKFKALGKPYCEPGQLVEISDLRRPERAGRYFVERTSVEYSGKGFYRTIQLGKKQK